MFRRLFIRLRFFLIQLCIHLELHKIHFLLQLVCVCVCVCVCPHSLILASKVFFGSSPFLTSNRHSFSRVATSKACSSVNVLSDSNSIAIEAVKFHLFTLQYKE